jgi:predicted component of type VI protein secretion system
MTTDDPIAFKYLEDKNPEQGTLPGVPLRDLTVSDVEGHPEWIQRSIAAHPMYRSTGKFKVAAVEETVSEEPKPAAKDEKPKE